ncbi:TonB-linked SusC/RagA family outer membrane protein [Mucilaginibacter yixingensis]|uniref:TonB-linked SusC/RagA family outer membrane protein n=1 Tax=Mucilaginibacter yixingensis TaxID=1295612 RepID=A0A2T5J8H7_9SPHI|nr:SusC/RagA family TonB-linked outer membrane protein [Mucilaginibacter yixingensis]PTQ95750.1 TonB-linked SusC/RagA family outer membrane protein [Mucilaginibacter yixingensis]
MRRILLMFSVLLLLSNALFAQTRTISGVVTGEKGETLPGVSIQVKGSSKGTTTDIDGKYSIVVTDMQSVVITVKYIGYTYQEKSVSANQRNADFKLVPTASNLNEVVITGYGEQKKATLTGAVSTVDLKKVEDIPALSVSAALKGTTVGLSISGGTSRPGQGTTIVIRNPSSYSKDGQGITPLYVIDDIIRTQADFDVLDISQIENISVLKDAEAAIYGVLGANGVILVRTKKGKMGAPKVSFSSSVGAANATTLPKMMNSVQLATWVNDYYTGKLQMQTTPGVPNNASYYDADGFKYTNGVKTTDPSLSTWYTSDEMAYFANHSHNYLQEAFKTAYTEREAVNISGGSEKTTYFVGGDFVNANSNFSGVNSYKYGLRANIETKPATGLTILASLSTDVQYSRSYWYKLASTSESLDNDAASLENVQPWQEYFINNNPVLLVNANGGYDNLNFFQVQNSNNFTQSNSTATNLMGKITYEIPGVKGLTATATMNKNLNSSNNKQFGTSFNYYQYAGTGANSHIPGGALLQVKNVSNGDRVRLNPVFANTYQLDAGLNYNRTFGKHSISATALYEQREQNAEGVAAEADGVVLGALPYQTFTVSTQTSNQSSQVSQFGFLSFISRLNYSYDNKYLVQLVYRADGSSRFADGNNWGGFPSASVGWVASEEPFLKNKFTWLDQLKFRASAGLTGTDNTKAYQYQASYKLGTGSSGGAVFGEGNRSIGIQTNVAIPNTAVTWDHIFKTDYGMDVTMLKSRLNLTLDYYWNHGYDMLTTLSSSVPATIGAAVPTENYSIVNMFGWEVSAGWRDHIGSKFTYSFTPFFAWSDNKTIRADVSSGLIGTIQDPTNRSSDLGFYGYHSLGIIRTQADADAIIAQRAAAAGGAANVKIQGDAVQPGMINYQDVNGDGIIDAKDMYYVKNKSSNHYNMGLNWSVGYGPVYLNVIMGLSWGGWTTMDGIKPFNQSSSSTGASIADNRPVWWSDHWTPSNTSAKYPAPYFTNNYTLTSDFWLVSATQFNVTSANLSYNIPAAWTKKIGISSARVYCVATNPIQFINPFPDHYRDFQTSMYTYPSLRTVSLGINVGL